MCFWCLGCNSQSCEIIYMFCCIMIEAYILIGTHITTEKHIKNIYILYIISQNLKGNGENIFTLNFLSINIKFLENSL